jgi:hypothetical protein
MTVLRQQIEKRFGAIPSWAEGLLTNWLIRRPSSKN